MMLIFGLMLLLKIAASESTFRSNASDDEALTLKRVFPKQQDLVCLNVFV